MQKGPKMACNCFLTNDANTTDLPVIEAVEGGKKTIEVILSTCAGTERAPVSLTEVDHVIFVARSSLESKRIFIKKEGDIIDDASGHVSVTLTKKELTMPGLWWGAFVTKDEEGNTIDQYACWLHIKKSIESTRGIAPITVPEVRAYLLDRCGDNELLGEMQCSDDEILNAMRLAVEEWNATPPVVTTFTTTNFPYRYPWLICTCAHVLRSLSIKQSRNNASFQTGTVMINDSDKGPIFQRYAEQFRQEWTQWMNAKKRELNVKAGWGVSIIGDF